ncbi:MAG: 2-polyprenylphenol 6-hydroxylase, partial [Pseudomonadota bacterium]
MGDLTRSADYRTAPPPPVAEPVQHPVEATLRLLGWCWVLVRHDALAPREITPMLPVWIRWLAHLL